MASTNYRNGRFVAPSSASSVSSETDESFRCGQKRKRPRRDANVYDAVAGEPTASGPQRPHPPGRKRNHGKPLTQTDPQGA